MTDKKLSLLQHALGLNEYGKGQRYRNHFVTGPGSEDYPVCVELVGMGLMEERQDTGLTGTDTLFTVTQEGIEYVDHHSPMEPVLTQAQRRYRQWLNSDIGETFIQFLKRTKK